MPPTIAGLPTELIAYIFRQFDNVRFLPPTILACRQFYSTFHDNPSIKSDVLSHQVAPGLLSYAIATLKASQADRVDRVAVVPELLKRLKQEPKKLQAELHDMPICVVLMLGKLHDTVHQQVIDFATSAWAFLSDARLVLSSTEHYRCCRAFYQFDILCSLLRADKLSNDEPWASEMLAKAVLLSGLPPWKNEQIGCAHDWFESQLLQAGAEVFAHDVQFGEYAIDYLSRGTQAPWLQLRISRGIEFIDRLAKSASYDAKLALLDPELVDASASPHLALDSEYDPGAQDSSVTLGDYPDEAIEALDRHQDPEDLDGGPYNAWRLVHADVTCRSFVMSGGKHDLRKRAYVLWDLNRLQSYELLEKFDELPGYGWFDASQEEYDAMHRSWQERSEIWQKGGRGYWSEGDLSRIEWL